MNRLTLIKIYLFTLCIGVATSSVAQPSSDDLFASAQQAYDAGDYASAVLHYETLRSNQVSNVEVEYNLANAYFKQGNLPQAISHYRTASYRAPRDPDIEANMKFAMNIAGVAEPSPTFFTSISSSLSLNEWMSLGIITYLILMALLIAAQLLPKTKRILLSTSLIPGCILLLAVASWASLENRQKTPEAVIVKQGAIARYGPIEDSTAHYNVPLAALVQQQKSNASGWVEIKYDGKIGWIKEEYILPVSP